MFVFRLCFGEIVVANQRSYSQSLEAPAPECMRESQHNQQTTTSHSVLALAKQ
jgi:hypothetical protein